MPDADGFTLAEAIKKDPAIAGATVVMLTSAGRPGDAARCRERGHRRATSPNRSGARNCTSAILLALGVRSGRTGSAGARHAPLAAGSAPQPGAFFSSRTTASTSWSPGACSRRRGHTVVVANNGREALAILDEARVRRVRLRAHGRPDAGDGRLRVHRRHSRQRTGDAGSSPDRRDDRTCDERGSRHAAWRRGWTRICRSPFNRTSSSSSSSVISVSRAPRTPARRRRSGTETGATARP